MKFIDHSGKKFGKLIAVSYDRNSRKWLCQCDCGDQSTVAPGDLVAGKTKSCGCAAGSRKHGNCPRGKHTPEYSSWYSMIARCRYETHKSFANYGGRGIRVCDRWQKFENFLADMGKKPGPGMSLDRINNDGDYEPGNCRWATQREQFNNQRKTRFVEYGAKRMSFSDAWRSSGSLVARDVAYNRFKNLGWSLERAFQRC